jgi:bile acid:Na+ symporter, BASS family
MTSPGDQGSAALMKYVPSTAVFLLMISIGMSISLPQFVENGRRLTVRVWLKLLAATFLLPPLLALALGQLLPLSPAATAGLFLVAVAPGAPLLTRGVAKKGFDLQMAASYQVWGAVLSPLMIPLLVAGGGWLYGRDIWIPPLKLLGLIARQQFLPLAAGMILMRLVPAFSARVRQPLNLIGNAMLTVAVVAILFKLGPALKKISPWLALAVMVLAVGCLLAVQLILRGPLSTVQTLAISNANRHVGLALLLSGQHLHAQRAVPAIAAYALAAVLVMGLYAKLARRAP